MKKSYFLMALLFLGLVVTIAIMAGCPLCFIDAPSIIMVLTCSIVLLLSNFKISEIRNYFSIGFENGKANAEELKKGILFFSSFQKYLFLSGGLGTLMGVTGMLANLGNPNAIGSGLALAFLTVIYAVILNMLIAMPFKTGLQKKLNEIT